jgi:glycosyltransferase involved in cell wall biosynthesis
MIETRSPAVCFIVESGTDARLVEGLAARVALTVFARAIPGGRAISQPTEVTILLAEPGRLMFAWRVFRLLLRRPCEVVLVQGYGVAALAANIAARLRGMACWMLVCSPTAEYYETRRQAGRAFSPATLMGIHLLGRLNGIVGSGYIVLSEYLQDVVRRYGRGKPVHVVPVYGVDIVRFTHRPDAPAIRTERGLPPRGQIVFNSSRVVPEKDTETLLEAFALLVREGRNVYLLNRSGGYEDVLRHGERLGIRGRLIATDAVDPRGELPLDYAAADVCVQASRAEGLGFSVLEAFACGTPVIASAVGGLLETVRDGITGWSVPPGDAQALAAALRDALDRPEEGRRRAAAGAALVRERFESDAVFDRLADILRQRTRPTP